MYKKRLKKIIHKKSTTRKRNVGDVPGAIVFTGEKKLDTVKIQYMEYNEVEFFEESVSGESIAAYHEPVEHLMQWYAIKGLHKIELIEEIGNIYTIHPLVLEDVADTNQRPKYEEFDNGNFFTCKAFQLNKELMTIESQQVAIYFGDGFIISFQEEGNNLFQSVEKRIRKASGRIRKRNADYLAYTLIDAITDNYFNVLDDVQLFIEHTEININENPNEKIKSDIYDLKIELLHFRKKITPMREAVGKFTRTNSNIVDDRTIPFLQDLFDHTIQVAEIVESQRDSLTGLQDLYISEVSYRMNKVMQLLTVVTTIFIPLSFLTGLYGMNFKYMPELQAKNGYFILLGVMAIIALGLLYYFKRKKWL